MFTFKRTKGGATHYVAATIPKTAVIEGFTDDPAKAKQFGEHDAKAMWAALEADAKVYGRWAVLDADGREVSVFTHATPEPKTPPKKSDAITPATPPLGENTNIEHCPDDSPFMELFGLLPFVGDPNDITLRDVANAALKEIVALRREFDDAPPADDDTVLTDPAA